METALKEAGTCGRFQVCHVVFTQLPRFVSVWGIMIMMFGTYDPGWRCKSGGRFVLDPSGNISVWDTHGAIDSNGNAVNVGNMNKSISYTHVLSPNSRERTRSEYHEETDYSLNGEVSSKNLSDFIAIGRGFSRFYNETCDVIEFCDDVEFNPESVTIVSEFRLVCDRKWILRTILLIMSVGFLTGALLGGQVGEKFGRKASLYGGCLITCVFSGLAILSNHWVMYTVFLFLVGMGGNFIQSSANIFTMEFLNSKWRSIFGSIPVWNISLCIFTFAASMMKSWIRVHVVTCAISFVACIGYVVLMESVRWLVVQGKYIQAEKVIQKVARINGKPSPTVETLLKVKEESESNSEKRTMTSKPTSSASQSSSTSSSTKSNSYTYIHLLKTRNLRILTFKFSTIFFMIFVTYFALSYGINSIPGDFYVNAVASSVCEISIVIITGPLCNKIGRRWGGFAVSMLGAISCLVIVIALFTCDGDLQETIIKTCAFLARGGSMAKSTVGTLFMVEHFPTAVRSVAFGVLRAMAGIGGLFGPFLIPEPGRESFAICFSIMACCFLISLVIFMSLPETNKLCLVDSIEQSSMKRVTEEECV